MAKIEIKCKKCGKPMKLKFSDNIGICKKCRKAIPPKIVKTSKNFDF